MPTCDVALLGYVEALAPGGQEWRGNDDVKWKTETINGQEVAFIGVAFSYWGNIIYSVIEVLSRYCLMNSYLTKIVRKDPNIICIYLTGSMLNEDPFIGGTTDVDLVIVHNHPRDIPRQIVPITEEATLDIQFFQQAYYTPQRKIRLDPWVGPALCFDPVLLYGKGHWFKFTQAAIKAGFLC